MDPSQFNRSTTLDDSQIVVLDSAKKHETEFASGRRKPTDADVRSAFRAAVRFGGPPERETGGVWKWEDTGLDYTCRPPRTRKRNNICFTVRNNTCVVFHYHKGFYD